MSHSSDGRRDVSDFLRGDAAVIGRIREAVRLVVRSFQFSDDGLNRDLAQDCLTSVFMNLAAGSFRGDSTLETYARRIARYTCLAWIRRRRFEASLNPETVPAVDRWSAPEESFLWTEEHLRNLEIFASLPAECRDLLKLIFIEGRSYREAGHALGLTEGAIKTRVHRCRAALKEGAHECGSVVTARRPRRVDR